LYITQSLKLQACAAIDDARGELFALADDLFRHPQTGFKEV
jgi:hypothetical protein